MRRRLFSCEGSIQLIAALAAARAFARLHPAGPADDWLLIHGLWTSEKQTAEFVRVLNQMAEAAGCWRGIIHLGPRDVDELQSTLRRAGPADAVAALKGKVGLDAAEELYIGQNRSFGNNLLLNAFSGAEKICYGDAIGINFSPNYFASTRFGSSSGLSFLNRVGQHTQSAIARARHILTRAAHRSARLDPLKYDHYCLMLPNLFDQHVDRYTPMAPHDFVELFDRLSDALCGDDYHAGVTLQHAFDDAPAALVLATSNFSEANRMPLENEITAYGEFIERLHLDRNSVVVLKPHPRDSETKIRRLTDALAQRFDRIIVLADAPSFYLPLEVVFSRHFHERPAGFFTVASFSIACLPMRHLFDVPCRLGFGEDLVRKYFAPQFAPGRLRHERDLARAIEILCPAPAATLSAGAPDE